MSEIPSHLEGLPARIWRPRHPCRPSAGKLRTGATVLLMLLLWSVILAYGYLTDESRVRAMAGDYLSGLLGGTVQIGGADLSLFEGLRLDNVSVTVPDGSGPQSTLFQAGTVSIHYSLRDLLTGHFAAGQIIAIEPRVRIAEDARTGQWNYQLLGRGTIYKPRPVAPTLPAIPEIVLRDAQVEYYTVADGQAHLAGSLALDGRVGPTGQADQYEFNFQSRVTQGVPSSAATPESLGPTIDGTADIKTQHVTADLRHFVFGPDIQAMLPIEVRRWCREHELAGRMSVAVEYNPGAAFHVEADLDGVELAVNPQSAASPDQPPHSPVKVTNASGKLIFTNNGIEARGATVWLENNGLTVNGLIGGYSPDAPLDVTVQTVGDLDIPDEFKLIRSLPPVLQETYQRFHPEGRGSVTLRLARSAPGETINVQANVHVTDGGFTFDQVPYPIRHAIGEIILGRDPTGQYQMVRLVNLRGHGLDGGPNATADISVDGYVGPLNNYGGGEVIIKGKHIRREERILTALPPPAQAALASLDDKRFGNGLGFDIDFSTRSHREHANEIADLPWITDTDLTVSDGQAAYVPFPYPLEKITGAIQIRDGYLDLVGIQAHHGPGAVQIDGRVDFAKDGKSFSPNLKMAAQGISVDDTLISALPDEAAKRLRAYGAAGKLDASGTVIGAAMDYDMNLKLRDGSLSPDQQIAATDATGTMHLTPNRLEVLDISGRRGAGTLNGRGWIDWTGGRQTISLVAEAKNLALDQSLYKLIPKEPRLSWDYLHPVGSTDAEIYYDNRPTAPEASASNSVPSDSAIPTTQPSSGLQVTLHPRDLSVAPELSAKGPPLQLEQVTGWVSWQPDRAVEWDIAGRRGQGRIALAGAAQLKDAVPTWNLRLGARDMVVDDSLIQSMPDGIAQVMQSLHVTGTVGFDFDRLSYSPTGSEGKASGPNVDFAVKLICNNASLSVGVPMDQIVGGAILSGDIRNGRLDKLDGQLMAKSLVIAGRSAMDMNATISKPADQPTIHLTNLKGVVAHGDLAGDLAVSLPHDAPGAAGDSNPLDLTGGRYAISLVLSGADVAELTGDLSSGLHGDMTASLQMSGSTSDAADRQGRGDVRVGGTNLYQIPLVLGLFQVTNLALPISTPFEHASARYSVQGQRVALEQIILSGQQTIMQGGGHIDFGTKQVELTFDTNNPAWLNVPLVGPVVNEARSELLRIHVKGSLKSPKVSASSFDTVTTTVDEVLRGGPGK